MMKQLDSFDFNGLGEVWAFEQDGDAWFVAKDVASLLGYVDSDQAVRAHTKASKTYPVKTTGQVRHVKIIPERDVYRLIMRSKLPTAESFEEWVVGTVLPAVRKTGGYVKGEESFKTEDEMVLHVMAMLQRKVEAMKPKAEYHDQWMSSNGDYTTTDLAKKLGTTATKLNIFLRENGVKWLNKDLPKAGYESWFNVIERVVAAGKSAKAVNQCLITPQGCKEITRLFTAAA